MDICSQCQEAITDNSCVVAGDKKYHENHFTCNLCQQSLSNQPYYPEQDGAINYCKNCYTTQIATKCAKCGNGIVDDIVQLAEGIYLHSDCFTCTRCSKQLQQGYTKDEDDRIICYECQESLADKCSSCNLAIMDVKVTALGKCFHKSCFKCNICSELIDEETFDDVDGQAVHRKCQKLTCGYCNQGIVEENEYYKHRDTHYHTHCVENVKSQMTHEQQQSDQFLVQNSNNNKPQQEAQESQQVATEIQQQQQEIEQINQRLDDQNLEATQNEGITNDQTDHSQQQVEENQASFQAQEQERLRVEEIQAQQNLELRRKQEEEEENARKHKEEIARQQKEEHERKLQEENERKIREQEEKLKQQKLIEEEKKREQQQKENELKKQKEEQLKIQEEQKQQHVQENTVPVQQPPQSFKVYSYDELIKNPASDVDPTQKEAYLSDVEFQKIFSMTKEEFSVLKAWRQKELKQKYKLF